MATKAIKKLQREASKIFFPSLGEFWKIIMFSDASHANLNDGVRSMGAHIVFLSGIANSCCALAWQANKLKWVVQIPLLQLRPSVCKKVLKMLFSYEVCWKTF